MSEVKYYLQDKSYFHGSYMNWWAKDSKGYTANLDNAHQFTVDEIAEMQSRGMRTTDIPWLCSYIDDKSARCVSATYCNYDEMKEQESILLSRSNNNGWIRVEDGLPEPEIDCSREFKPTKFYLIQLKSGLIDIVAFVNIYYDADDNRDEFVVCTINRENNKYVVQEYGQWQYDINEVKCWQPMPQPSKE